MQNLKNTYETGLQELKTLRDQIRVKIQLASQEARTQWETHLEPHYDRIEQQIKDVKEDTIETLKEAIEAAKTKFQEFRSRLSGVSQGQSLDDTQRSQLKNS